MVRQTVDECIAACLEALDPTRSTEGPVLRASWRTRPDTQVLAQEDPDGRECRALAAALARRADEEVARSKGEPTDIFRRMCVWQAVVERFDSKALLKARPLVDLAVLGHHLDFLNGGLQAFWARTRGLHDAPVLEFISDGRSMVWETLASHSMSNQRPIERFGGYLRQVTLARAHDLTKKLAKHFPKERGDFEDMPAPVAPIPSAETVALLQPEAIRKSLPPEARELLDEILRREAPDAPRGVPEPTGARPLTAVEKRAWLMAAKEESGQRRKRNGGPLNTHLAYLRHVKGIERGRIKQMFPRLTMENIDAKISRGFAKYKEYLARLQGSGPSREEPS